MKKINILLTLLSVPFLLVSCNEQPSTTTTTDTPTTTSEEPTSSEPENPLAPEIYNISKTISSHIYTYQQGPDLKIMNFEEHGDIPYVRFERLFSAFYGDLMGYNVTFKFSYESDGVFKFYLKEYPNYEYFYVDVFNDTITIGRDDVGIFGELSTNSKGTRYFVTGEYTNFIRINDSLSKTHVQPKFKIYDLGKYNLDIVLDENEYVYFPFHVLNDLIIMPLNTSLIFNGKEVFYAGYLNYVLNTYRSTSPWTNKTTRTKTLAQYTYNEYLFFMENIYGLSKERGFNENFDKILSDNGYKTGLLSTDTATYENTMARLTAKIFYDGHSGYTLPSLFVSDNWNTYTNLYSTTLSNENQREIDLMSTYNTLRVARNNAGKSIGYEKAGSDTAIIRFDSFSMNKNRIDNVDVDNYSYSQLSSDTILLFIKAFKAITADTSIKNVVVDIAMNGGGAADTLPWLTAFFTQTPSLTVMHDQTGECIETYYDVDLNFDGVYDEKDTYAGKYNFYLLTSGYSFSCGNYYPTVMKEKGLMTLIGHKSGGGECAVGNYVNGSGTILRNSSGYHLGHYNSSTKKFVGNDNGIEVDYELDYTKYYNNTELVNFIHSIQD